MPEESPPYWVLISVLFSSQPLTPAVAMTLHQAALELYRTDGAISDVAGDLISGKVRNLRKDVLLGHIAGPMFEAEIDTERGAASVRFLLPRQGLEMMEARAARPSMLPQYRN
jgi:hypothetical protein